MLIAIAIAGKIFGFLKDCIEFLMSLKNLGWRAADARRFKISQERVNDSFCGTKTQMQDVGKGWERGKMILIKKKALSAWSQDEINGPEENGVAMTIKKAEEAKKSKRSKILQQNLKLISTSMQSLVNLISFLPWRWQWASIGHFVFLLKFYFQNLFFYFWNLSLDLIRYQNRSAIALAMSILQWCPTN